MSHVTKVCGAFGGCEISTKQVRVRIVIHYDNVIKDFETYLKVLKHLPYDIMLGRHDMMRHYLKFVQTNPHTIAVQGTDKEIPRHALKSDQFNTSTSNTIRDIAQMSMPSQLPLARQGVAIPPADLGQNLREDSLITRPSDTQEEQLPKGTTADKSKSSSLPVGETTTGEGDKREPINENIRHSTDVTGTSDKNTDPLSRRVYEDFIALVRDVRAITENARKKPKLIRHMGKHRLAAVRAARAEGVVARQSRSREVASSRTLSHKVRRGLQQYRLLTDTAGRDVEGFERPIVNSHLTPSLCKRRQLIGAAKRLELEVAQGKALALEIPIDMSGFATNHNGKPELDEHLNLVRDYQVDLHNKLVNSEENRAHMSTYINFEEDALGDNGILGKKDIDYFIDKQRHALRRR